MKMSEGRHPDSGRGGGAAGGGGSGLPRWVVDLVPSVEPRA